MQSWTYPKYRKKAGLQKHGEREKETKTTLHLLCKYMHTTDAGYFRLLFVPFLSHHISVVGESSSESHSRVLFLYFFIL